MGLRLLQDGALFNGFKYSYQGDKTGYLITILYTHLDFGVTQLFKRVLLTMVLLSGNITLLPYLFQCARQINSRVYCGAYYTRTLCLRAFVGLLHCFRDTLDLRSRLSKNILLRYKNYGQQHQEASTHSFFSQQRKMFHVLGSHWGHINLLFYLRLCLTNFITHGHYLGHFF